MSDERDKTPDRNVVVIVGHVQILDFGTGRFSMMVDGHELGGIRGVRLQCGTFLTPENPVGPWRVEVDLLAAPGLEITKGRLG